MTIFLILILAFLNKVQASDAEMETLFKKQSDNLALCGTLNSLTLEMQDNVKQRDVLRIDYERLFYGKQICEIALDKSTQYYTHLERVTSNLENVYKRADIVAFSSMLITDLRSQIEPLLASLKRIEDERVEALRRQDYLGEEEFSLQTPSDSSVEYLIYVPSLSHNDLTWENIKESFDAEKKESLKSKLSLKLKELSRGISCNQEISRKLELVTNHKNSKIEQLTKRFNELQGEINKTLSKLS